jgi:hypothetical protein
METNAAMRDDQVDPANGEGSATAAQSGGTRPLCRRRAVYLNDIRSRAYQKWLAAGGRQATAPTSGRRPSKNSSAACE